MRYKKNKSIPIARSFKIPGKFLLEKKKDFEVLNTKQTTDKPKNPSNTKLYDNSAYEYLVKGLTLYGVS